MAKVHRSVLRREFNLFLARLNCKLERNTDIAGSLHQFSQKLKDNGYSEVSTYVYLAAINLPYGYPRRECKSWLESGLTQFDLTK